MKIFIGADHAGFELKGKLVAFLRELGYEVSDLGPSSYVPADDYPDLLAPVARQISKNPEGRGIVIGGSGQGEATVANRFPRVRAAVFYGGGQEIIKLSREHNNANVLALGARFLSESEAKEAVRLWLETPFLGEERHVRRIKKIEEISK
ncbi:MAG: RpiB/LacA/LacB family sugar-phosphate isomerase [Candidatus Taylorbacteria bacterium]|nr:RpiB/LacA/LacB family sugar-phosphate isomerase [Candidatus Taylorbacteria bacterium]